MRVDKPHKDALVFIVGPTGIGKTNLALRLAKKIRGEIISCDSMQIYRSMGILSQAPSPAERRLVKHHLVGVLDPARDCSVAYFRKRALTVIRSVIKRNNRPIAVGGSGLYVKALIDGLFPSPPEDALFREKMRKFISRYGSQKLHDRLKKTDPESAENIHPNDIRRTIRALEVFETTGKTMTELKRATKGLKDVYDIKIFGLTAPRELIYSRIGSRADAMFASGAVREAKKLGNKRLSKTAAAVLGLKEISGYLQGEYDIETAKDMVKMNTRRFAKRQLTWFRPDKRIKWFDIAENSAADIIKYIKKEVR